MTQKHSMPVPLLRLFLGALHFSSGTVAPVGGNGQRRRFKPKSGGIPARRLIRLTGMVKYGIRRCDVCDREIAKGETYLVNQSEKGRIPEGVGIADTGFTMDSLGNVQLDICMGCHEPFGRGNGQLTGALRGKASRPSTLSNPRSAFFGVAFLQALVLALAHIGCTVFPFVMIR